MSSYDAFLHSKVSAHIASGFSITIDRDWLFPFQKFVTEWALSKGRAAVFADTGLGKTRIQLAWADAVATHTGLPVLILCPLAVAGQTIEEGVECGIAVGRLNTGSRIEIANYDRLKDADPSMYGGIVLDESSILKNFAGAVRNRLVDSFAHTQFRLCLTATPAPNDHTELGNHAEFLGVMGMSGMLSRWFVHDSMNTSEWRLKGHAETEFWRWCASWTIAFRKPSDIGFLDDGYDLPALEMIRHTVETDPSETGSLISDAKLSATTLHKEMRRTARARSLAVSKLVSKWQIGNLNIQTVAENDLQQIPNIGPNATIRGRQRTNPHALNTCENTENVTQSGGSEHPNSNPPSTSDGEQSTRATPITERSSNPQPAHRSQRIQKSAAIRSFAQLSALGWKSTTSCLLSKAADAQSVDAHTVTNADGDSLSITVTAAELSEDCSVLGVTKGSEHSGTVPNYSPAPLNTFDPGIVWCNTDYEQDELDAVLGETAISIRGSDSPALKEALHDAWMSGIRPVLICKPASFGFGMNWQHCSRMAFVGLSYSYEAMYQAIRRCWRFGQTRPVAAHIVTADSEWSILESIDRKKG